jgi:hypothetical protein
VNNLVLSQLKNPIQHLHHGSEQRISVALASLSLKLVKINLMPLA